MIIDTAIGLITNVIERVIPDQETKVKLQMAIKEHELELKKMEAEEISNRIGLLRDMIKNKNFFVSGGIPALIWVFNLAIVNNFILGPWAQALGLSVPQINLPGEIVALIGTVIFTLLGKKTIDNNEIWWKGQLLSPSKQEVEAKVRKIKSLD